MTIVHLVSEIFFNLRDCTPSNFAQNFTLENFTGELNATNIRRFFFV